MKCVCVRDCYIRNTEGRPQHFSAGQVEEFKKVPNHFRAIEGKKAGPVDFDTAQEQELREAEYDLDELKAFIEKRYDKKARNRGKEKTVDLLLDSRYRDIDNVDLNKVL